MAFTGGWRATHYEVRNRRPIPYQGESFLGAKRMRAHAVHGEPNLRERTGKASMRCRVEKAKRLDGDLSFWTARGVFVISVTGFEATMYVIWGQLCLKRGPRADLERGGVKRGRARLAY